MMVVTPAEWSRSIDHHSREFIGVFAAMLAIGGQLSCAAPQHAPAVAAYIHARGQLPDEELVDREVDTFSNSGPTASLKNFPDTVRATGLALKRIAQILKHSGGNVDEMGQWCAKEKHRAVSVLHKRAQAAASMAVGIPENDSRRNILVEQVSSIANKIAQLEAEAGECLIMSGDASASGEIEVNIVGATSTGCFFEPECVDFDASAPIRIVNSSDVVFRALPSNLRKILSKGTSDGYRILPGTAKQSTKLVQRLLHAAVQRTSEKNAWNLSIPFNSHSLLVARTQTYRGHEHGWLLKTKFVERTSYAFVLDRPEGIDELAIVFAVLVEEAQEDYIRDDWRVCQGRETTELAMRRFSEIMKLMEDIKYEDQYGQSDFEHHGGWRTYAVRHLTGGGTVDGWLPRRR